MRVLPGALDRTTFLDVETDGLGPAAQVTTVVACRPGRIRAYIRGMDLERLPQDLRSAPLLVTYNGRRFDLPVLRRQRLLPPQILHLDLCTVLHAWGYYGGLKAVVRRLELAPTAGGAATGADAPTLWNRFAAQADGAALAELLRYNARDAAVLLPLAWRALAWSFSAYPLRRALPPCPDLPDVVTCLDGSVAL